MGKIRKFTKALGAIAKQPSLLNNVLNDSAVWQRYVRKYGFEDGLPMVNIETLVPGFSGTVPVFAFLDGGSLPTDILLLMKLASRFENCKYFEIGTWRVESVANVASVASECYTLNLPDEDMRALGLPESYVQLHGKFSKELKNVVHLKADSRTFDYAGLNKKFDLIFIDGDHHKEFVENDTRLVFEHLVHDKTIVVWHDYARNPETIRYDVLAGILDGTPKEFHQHIYHAGNCLCAVFIREEFPAEKLVAPVEPKHYFEVSLKLKNC
jgi:methyltransferase family protein